MAKKIMAKKKDKENQEEKDKENQEVRLALKWTDLVVADIPIPEDQKLVNGYAYNDYTGTVSQSCSTFIGHGLQWDRTNVRGPIAQYSSKLLALKALRNALESKYAKQLREIDLMIKQEAEESVLKIGYGGFPSKK
jgi:hypothetical protein